VIDYIQNYHRK